MKRIADLAEIPGLPGSAPRVVLHSGSAEPATLVSQMVAHAAALKGAEILTLSTMSPAPYADPAVQDYFRLATFSPGRAMRKATASGRVEVLRTRLAQIPALFQQGHRHADLLLLKLSPPDRDGRCYLGVDVDYMHAVLAQAPIVVAEIDPATPRIGGDSTVRAEQIDYYIEGSGGPHVVEKGAGDETERRIAGHIAGLVRNGCTVQTGIGAIPDLVMAELAHLRDLGLHTGIITDAIQKLIESGIVTNARKKIFPGQTVATMAAGSTAFYRFLNDNPAIALHPCSLTHDPAQLALIENLCAINGVLEIDLHGRANAERLDGRLMSAPGGLPDFAEGARRSPGGASIVALRSTSRDGSRSRICGHLPPDAPVTVGPAEIDYVVTEHGVAHIGDRSPGDRARALITIADPAFRAELLRDWARSEAP